MYLCWWSISFLFFRLINFTISKDSKESWRNIPNCIGTVYNPNPLANGWILRHGPDIPALNELKNTLIVNTHPIEPKRPATVVPANENLT
ncbi:hypothetical protein HPULCUR_004463 [Helicostylum pulchrum]|uniref:Uncharacterized protein n=1 Tax=Helicostylum pulchrum TaxID=562976 RepID=A0ABP9XWB1_9FUNG